MDRLFEITELGYKVGGNTSPRNRNSVLDRLRDLKRASTEQVAAMTGLTKYAVLAELRKLAERGLVKEVGNGNY